MKRSHEVTEKWRRAVYLSLSIAAWFPTAALGQPDSSQLSRAEAVKAVETLTRWFECADCGQSGLRAVTRYGQSVVPSLIATLNAGLSPASRELLRRLVDSRYDELVDQAQKRPDMKMASSKEEFIARYLDGYDAQYRIRAAQALSAIGGTNARSALETNLGKAERADVRTAIQRSLNEIR